MTYPPGNPGYPPAQQGNQYAAPAAPEAGPSKLPAYLTAAVAAFGLGTYAFNFGPLLTISNSDFPQFGSASGSTPGLGLAVAASVLAALLAIVGLLPKQKARTGLVAVIATLSFLLVLSEVINAPAGLSIGWGLYLIIATTVLQAGAAIAALLFDAGVLTPPAPKPRYEQPYGQYGQPYYGQPQYGGPEYGGPAAQQQQRPGYPSQYGYQGGPSTGGFPSAQGAHNPGAHNGPPTPPTGFPAFGQPARAGDTQGYAPGASEATGYAPGASEATGYVPGASEATGYAPGASEATGYDSAPTTAVPSQPQPTQRGHAESSPQSGTPSS